ncbi:MAG TPA: hypothetical protein PKE31_16995 [Pseudomonadota bacterium]|jgi:tetratricopeptide (TPR) repeat protein|nr:hypothetical protein [Pseudomonadota bacterium]
MKRSGLWAVGLFALSFAGGCPPAQEVKTDTAATTKLADLPQDPAALVKIADEQLALGGVGYRNAQLAMEKALGDAEWAKQKASFDAHFRLAQAIAEQCALDEGTACQAGLQKGTESAHRAIELSPERVEGHYYLAQLIGFAAQTQRGADVKPMLNQLVVEAEAAIKINEKFDSAGPLRMLGTVYTRAPAPPVALGDPEKGVGLLQRAVSAVPDHPLNYIYLAEAQVADERYQDAQATVQKARQLLSDAKWNSRRTEWKDVLSKVERKLKAKQGQ